MRLEFNVLWVEDQQDAVKSQRERIEVLLRKQGFKLQVQFAKSVAEARTFLSSDIYGDHIDLVLMDFDLGAGPNGSEGLKVVREAFAFKDIVFYSAGGVPALQKAVAEGNVPGVFCSSRLDLPGTTFGVFEALVKKVLDIDHSRGIVMGTTSEIDHFVNEALLNAFATADDKLQKAALTIVKGQLADIRKTFDKNAAKVEAATDVSALLVLHHVYSSAHRLKLLRKLLDKQGSHADESAGMVSYETDTMPKRNDLAHVRVLRTGFSRKIYDRKGIEITIEDMQALRVALLEYHELFERISTSLQPKGSP